MSPSSFQCEKGNKLVWWRVSLSLFPPFIAFLWGFFPHQTCKSVVNYPSAEFLMVATFLLLSSQEEANLCHACLLPDPQAGKMSRLHKDGTEGLELQAGAHRLSQVHAWRVWSRHEHWQQPSAASQLSADLPKLGCRQMCVSAGRQQTLLPHLALIDTSLTGQGPDSCSGLLLSSALLCRGAGRCKVTHSLS